MHTQVDTLILGAGAAGLQMAHCLHQAGRSYLVLEAGATPGTFFTQYPRHRKLISINKVHTGFDDREKNLRWDWNSLLCDDDAMQFKNYSKRYWPAADDLVRYLADFASHHGLHVRYGTEAARIERTAGGAGSPSGKSGGFTVTDAEGRCYSGKRIVVATGVRKAYVPQIPGIEFCENYTSVNVDPETFVNQRVLILGKGNSAFEMAELLTETTAMIHVCSPNPIKMAWATHHVGHLRAVNNNFLDTYQLKTQNAVLDATVQRVERRGNQLVASLAYAHAAGEVEEIAYDRIIVCTGFRMDTDPFAEDVRPQLCIQDRFPALTSSWESVNVPGMYFAGTLMQSRDFKKTSSGFIHGFRYNVRALFQLLERRHHGRALPSKPVSPTASACTQAALAVINRSSALWQQFGFLGDLMQVNADGGISHYSAMPVDHIHDTLAARGRDYFIVTLEYGHEKAKDPFQIHRPDSRDAGRAEQSSFLHPVVRHCRDGQVLAEQHLMEHLETDWTQPHHVEPLLAFFQRTLKAARRYAEDARALA